MSNNKQSSVDAIIQFMKDNQYFIGNDLYEFFQQAKAMHKEEMRLTYNQGLMSNFQNFEDFYNETFGGNNEQQ